MEKTSFMKSPCPLTATRLTSQNEINILYWLRNRIHSGTDVADAGEHGADVADAGERGSDADK